MFTGIVTHVGTVQAVTGDTDRRLEVAPGFDPAELAIGASVAHSGVCLTVVERRATTFLVQASAETLARTTIGGWRPGTAVNLERSLRLGDELGGHLVFGHVDALGLIRAIEPVGQSWRFLIGVPPALAPLLAVKGSVAVDGISLTVTEAGADGFATVVIPHSFAVTTLSERRVGDHLNIEVDMLARYVARQLASAPQGPAHAR